MTPMHAILAILVLAGAVFLFYSKRNTGDDYSEPDFAPDAEGALTAAKAGPNRAGGVNARHVAVITAAVLAATRGRGKILNIAPVSRAANDYSEATRRWRAAGIVASVGRRLAPSWKR